MPLIVSALVHAGAILVASRFLAGVTFVAPTSTHFAVVLAVAGLVMALVNSFVKPVIKLVSFPIYLLTLGLFGLIVNCLMLGLASWICTNLGYGVTVDGAASAFWAGVIVAICTVVANSFLPRRLKVKH